MISEIFNSTLNFKGFQHTLFVGSSMVLIQLWQNSRWGCALCSQGLRTALSSDLDPVRHRQDELTHRWFYLSLSLSLTLSLHSHHTDSPSVSISLPPLALALSFYLYQSSNLSHTISDSQSLSIVSWIWFRSQTIFSSVTILHLYRKRRALERHH